MRYGFIITEQTDGSRATVALPAIDAWIAKAGGHVPDVLPIWTSSVVNDDLRVRWYVDRDLIRGLRERGIEPVIYAESRVTPYRNILNHEYDADLAFLAERAEGCAIRWNQEMDGSWGTKWQEADERVLYSETAAYVGDIWRAEGGCRFIWCPSIPKRAAEMGLFPGPAYVDIMAFDRFSYEPTDKPPEVRWPISRNQCTLLHPTAPVWVCETGTDVGNPKRAEYLRSMGRVEGIEVACVFDMHILVMRFGRPPIEDDWRWTPSMYKTWPTLS